MKPTRLLSFLTLLVLALVLAACNQTTQPLSQLPTPQLEVATLHEADPGFNGNLANPSITFTLEGCRNTGGIVLPNANGDFVCVDGAYTTGNLGKGWNELDLVPHRVTLRNTSGAQSYTFIVAGDYTNKAGDAPDKLGWDVISKLTLNAAKSSATCPAAITGPLTITPSGSGVGGADQTIYRKVDINQPNNTTCVYDYFQRLALGASEFSGSSLQSNLWNKSLTSSGIGQKRLSIPVKDVLPQELRKDMSASRGSAHNWNLTKAATPATLTFENTCLTDTAARQANVSITIEWTKLAATPDGATTIITNIYAKNPASRAITVTVTDKIYQGLGQAAADLLDTATSDPTVVAANTELLILTHTHVTTSTATQFNDVATASYTDTATGIAIPQTTEAKASATVQSSGATSNASATITDTESITGDFLEFSANSFTPAASGSFDSPYVAGTQTTGPVDWTSVVQNGSGSVTFAKTVFVTQAANTSGTLSDTATLTGSDVPVNLERTAPASTAIQASALVTLTINKTIPNVLTGTETQTFNFKVKDSANNVVAEPSITFTAGQTSKSVDVSGLQPGSYTVSEDPATNWNAQADKDVTINLPSCAGSVTFNNDFNRASAKVKKVTVPAGEEAGWEFTLSGPGTPVGGEKVTTTGAGFISFPTVLQEGNYTITETLKDGYDFTSKVGCEFTVNYPADAGRVYECTYTNTKRGKIIIDKVTIPSGDAQVFNFTLTGGPSVLNQSFGLADATTPHDSGLVKPGSGYAAAETVPAGWDLTSATCDNGSAVGNISVAAGQTVTCTFTNTKRGMAKVIKTVSGAPLSGTQAFKFQIRQGATDTSLGDILEEGTANAANGGVIEFTTKLVPGTTYQMCEVVPVAWTTSLGDYGSPLTVPNHANDPEGDNSTICVSFTVSAGELKVFTIDNSPPPGGGARTIGYWKNWNSCTNGGQTDSLSAAFTKAGGSITLGNKLTLTASDCLKAVNLLDKRTMNTGKKMASDPLFNMTAQLLAAKLNLASGAYTNAQIVAAIADAEVLLSKYNFNGETYSPKLTKADATKANTLANTLDKYNNNNL